MTEVEHDHRENGLDCVACILGPWDDGPEIDPGPLEGVTTPADFNDDPWYAG